MKKYDNKTLILAAVMFVVILLMTWLLRMDIPYEGKQAGYWTLGDVGIYITAALLGGPWAALCAAVGSALADIIVGQAVYAPASLVVKALWRLCSYRTQSAGTHFLHLIKSVAYAGGVMVLGYFLYDLIIRGDYVLAAIGLPFNILQVIASGLIAVPVLF
jgi:uncharacterized membrane protein